MEQENKKITKIVISSEDELTDVVTGILESPNERIVLTFAEESDLLISPINLKVIQETSDDENKLLIAQIINNPTGIKNARSAGMATIETTTLPLEDDWKAEQEKKEERLSPKPATKDKKIDSIDSSSIETPKEEEIPIIIEGEDMGISIDNDLPTEKDVLPKKESRLEELKNSDYEQESDSNVNSPKKSNAKKVINASSKDKFRKEKRKLSPKTKKLLGLIGGSLLVIILLALFIYYKTAPYVRIRMYIEAREASIERVFTGDENIKEIDFEENKIPIKFEKAEKERSTTIKATGTAYRGEKAKGTIIISYWPPDGSEDCPGREPVILEAGHSVISGSNKAFTLEKSITFSCEQIAPQSVGIVASDIGDLFNLPAATSFSIQGFSGTVMKGIASQPTTGGTKEEYKVLSQVDVNNGVEELQKISFEDGERELKDKSGGTWEIISDSLKSEIVKDSIKTDKTVGSEAEEANLSLKSISTATFFMKDGFDEKLSELFTKEAEEKNLFETDKNFELTLSNDISQEISVVENSPTSPQIKLVAKASIKPKVEKQSVIDAIKGKKWEEGLQILNTFVFSDKKTEVVFDPKSFPEKLKYFPTKSGGIVIEFQEAI